MKWMRTALFWIITQELLTLEFGTDKLSRTAVKKLPPSLLNNPEERNSYPQVCAFPIMPDEGVNLYKTLGKIINCVCVNLYVFRQLTVR